MTTQIDLRDWKIQDFSPGEGVTRGAPHPAFDDAGWTPASAPGDVHTALLAAGRIEDPFYDRNEEKCAWVEEREWWYRCNFTPEGKPLAADERFHLVFEGLDTYVTVWFNGEEVGSHRNMFRPAIFDVSQRVQMGQPNTVALCFHRPLDRVGDFDLAGFWPEGAPRVAMRKAQFGYGWDWGPRLPTVGIWRPALVRRVQKAHIVDVHFATIFIEEKQERALVSVTVEAEAIVRQSVLRAYITLAHGDGTPTQVTAPLRSAADGRMTTTVYLTINQPALWWTHDLGKPNLYDLTVTLHAGAEQLDERHSRVGVRTLQLDQSVDTAEPGTRFFRFVLNGVPIFAKGANWIPAHSFVGSIPPERYRMLLQAAVEANMNTLRIWGGGIYEHDGFYDLCDALGLLVWQDFMFACAMYPEEPAWFVEEVEQEARYQVRRLRNHPCLALWCGNNENQWLFDMINWNEPGKRLPGALYYHHILPAVVAELDGHTPYWPGSPYGGNDYNSQEDGDVHNWNAWHGGSFRRFGEQPKVDHSPAGVSYRRYGEDRGRFISEFGLHASPVYETLRRNIPADQRFHHSPSMDHHNKDNPKNKGDNLMEGATGLPSTLEQYIDFSMIAQAEGLKFAVEHYRRRKPHCSGTLIWQLNDCWPVLSWSLMDYYGFGKAGYYYVRRAYAPVLASFKQEGDRLSLWITNDTLTSIADQATVALRTFTGDTLWSETIAVQVAANSSGLVWSRTLAEGEAAPDRYLTVESSRQLFAANRHFFGEIKELVLPTVTPSLKLTQVNLHELTAELSADCYTYFVHLIVPHEATHFSDNYFDLAPGDRRTIRITNSKIELTPDLVTLSWLDRQRPS